MFCENCGAQLEPEMKFCTSCGAPVSEQGAVRAGVPEQNTFIPQSQTPVSTEPTNGATNVLMNEYYRAASGQNEVNANANMQSQALQPERYTAAYPVMAVKPPKKKRKLIPVCIAAGSVAAVAGTGLIVYNCNKASFTHAAMGDAGYAHSIVMGSLSSKETSSVLNAVQKAGSAAMSSGSALNSAMQDQIGSSIMGSGNHDYSAQDQASMTVEYITKMLNESVNTNGLGVTVSASVELEKEAADNLRSMFGTSVDSEDFDSMLKSLNNFRITASEKDSGSALEYALAMYDGNDSLGGAQFRYEKDGTATFIFPEISKNGITFDMPEFSWSEAQKDIPETYDFTKLMNSISEKTKEVFEQFDYEYENGSKTVNGVDFNGMTVGIKLGMDDVCDLYIAVMETALDDEDFVEYIADLSDMSRSSVVNQLDNSIDQIKMYSKQVQSAPECIDLEIYMNNDNTLAGVMLKVEDKSYESSSMEMSYISNGKDAAAVVEVGGVEYVSFKAKGVSSSEGTAKLQINTGGYSGSKITVNCDYKNVGKMNVFGIPSLKGDFEIYLDDATAEMISPYDSNTAAMISGSKLLLSAAPNGKGAKYTFGIEVEDFGRVSISMAADEPSGSVAPKPDGSYKLTDVNDIDNDFSEALMNDFMEHFNKLAEKDSVFGSILQPSYSGAIDDSRITSANTTAAMIKNQTTTFLTKMDSMKKTYTGGETALTILVENGVWTNFYGGGAYDWNDGEDHWGTSSDKGGDKNSEYVCYMADVLSDLRDGFITLYIKQNGSVAGVVFVNGDYTSVYNLPSIDDFADGDWDYCGSSKAGKIGNAYVGTSPCLALDKYSYYSF